MIISFADGGAADIFDGQKSKKAAKSCPAKLWNIAYRKLDMLNQAEWLDDLRSPPGNRLESLKADRKGQYSLRINDHYRMCFVWTSNGPDKVEIVDYD